MPFSKEEVFSALLDFNGNKALGLYESLMAFWLFSWNFVKDDMIFFFKEFYDEGKFEKCLNGMFLVLISKKEGVEDLKEFRLRSLVNGMYMFLAYILA